MIKIVLSLLSCMLIFTRKDSHTTIHLKAANVEGLNTKAAVTINGQKIGHVVRMGVRHDGLIHVEVKLDKLNHLPVGTRFMSKNADLLGTRMIEVIPGNEKIFIQISDTLELMPGNDQVMSDSLLHRFRNVFERSEH